MSVTNNFSISSNHIFKKKAKDEIGILGQGSWKEDGCKPGKEDQPNGSGWKLDLGWGP